MGVIKTGTADRQGGVLSVIIYSLVVDGIAKDISKAKLGIPNTKLRRPYRMSFMDGRCSLIT